MNNAFVQQYLVWLVLGAIWSLAWKAVALWRAGRLNQKGWFVALFVINTVGILEIIYLVMTKEKQLN